jgi:hypothetical protein
MNTVQFLCYATLHLSMVASFTPTSRISASLKQRQTTNMVLIDYPPPGERRNYARPDFESTSIPQREAAELSAYFNHGVAKNKPLKVAIIGGK